MPVRTSSQYTMLGDFADGLKMWRMWLRLAWLDVLQRYRRSILGPLWITLTMGVTIAGMGLVFGTIFNLPTKEYVPYLCTGIIIWTFLSSMMNEANIVFISQSTVIKNIWQPYSIHIFRLIARANIILMHHMLIYVAVALVFGVPMNNNLMYLLPSIAIYSVCSFSFCVILGLACARFRDIAPIVQNVLQFIMYFTPIFWQASMVGNKRQFIVDPNPFYHFVEILRGPLLGYPPTAMNWWVTIGVAGMSLVIAQLMFKRGAKRLAYWI